MLSSRPHFVPQIPNATIGSTLWPCATVNTELITSKIHLPLPACEVLLFKHGHTLASLLNASQEDSISRPTWTLHQCLGLDATKSKRVTLGDSWFLPDTHYRPLPRGAGSPAGCSLQRPGGDPAPSPANTAPRDMAAASRSPQALSPWHGSALGLPQNAGMAQDYQYKLVLPVKATTCNSRVTLNEMATACQYKLNRFCNGLGVRHSFCKCANEARTFIAAAYLSYFFLLLQHEAK